MRRTRWFRLLAAILAVWVPLAIGESSVHRFCPMHDAPAAQTQDVAAHSGHSAHSDHSTASTSADQGTHHAPSPDGAHPCNCIAGCCASTVAVVVPDAPIAAVIVAALETSGYTPMAPTRARPAPEFARPHATGPPRA